MTGPPEPLADAAEAPLALADVSVRYPAQRAHALSGITLSLRPGERVGVAGRTGAGKSTLTLLAAGFIPRIVRASIDGSAVVAGRDIRSATASDLLGHAGIVFATPANQLSGSKLTVREELAFGLENLGVERSEMDRRIDDVLERLGIAHLAEREPYALSGGEQQRVAIASIVAMGTSLLVLDEPTAQLDPAGTAAVAGLLVDLTQRGAAVLCAEHDPIVIQAMDRCLVLDAGHPVALDQPGRALASRTLDPIGLEPPTLVRLAEAADVQPALAFDEQAIAESLARMGTRRGGSGLDGEAGRAPDTPTWRPAAQCPVPSVAIEAVRHRYPGGVEALRGVSLSIAPGQSVAIIGQNGSGKTTLVKHLNGLLKPDQGVVRIGDLDTRAEPVHRLAATVGFVFQNPDDQLFERSVEREVAFGPRSLGRRPDEVARAVEASLEAVGLTGARGTNPYDLDLSRRKLVGLASVIANNPGIVVLDEPTTGQDGPGVARVGMIVDGLRGAGRTVVAITHDMEFAARHFERIVVMRLGAVVADGPPEEVLAAAAATLLASTGLVPPPAARIAGRLGINGAPADAVALLRSLGIHASATKRAAG
jgi:energy-coupling factor transporter ATP-binding protein EcfA2